ncbi:SIR2 family protein [Vibrio sp. DW001]|uniref:SIR2 family protein n=1 Tax=Vibrio sp. DW001 TaxID=2912315 RepID=UPI0023B10025|nr:SIR2 family protein [Vibrio sp. DW001]WED25455.1 SIR2 family protein [Vibrio sp. DW001]
MKLFILGAGASKAYGDSKTGIRMPIACDFFETYDKLDIPNNLWVLQGQIHLYIMNKYGIDPYTYLRKGIDIEDFHSSIEEDIQIELAAGNKNESMFHQMSYNELIYLFSFVINEIQNGPISKPHLRLAESVSQSDVIATFNWDTLIERALEHTSSWNVNQGYSFSPKSVYRNGWDDSDTNPNNEMVQLLKLHGSTNWLTIHPNMLDGFTTLNRFVKPEDVYVYESTKEPYPCHRGRFMEGYGRFSYGYYPVNLDMVAYDPDGQKIEFVSQPKPHFEKGKAPRDGVPTIPLIIPPVKQKKYDQYGELFGSLWSKTSEAIQKADEIILIGYSFPKTDIKSTQLFIQSFMKRVNKPKIKILDPNPEKIAEKFIYEFGFTEAEVQVYKDYFSEDFDIEALIKN